jgi:hypothetical protein
LWHWQPRIAGAFYVNVGCHTPQHTLKRQIIVCQTWSDSVSNNSREHVVLIRHKRLLVSNSRYYVNLNSTVPAQYMQLDAPEWVLASAIERDE